MVSQNISRILGTLRKLLSSFKPAVRILLALALLRECARRAKSQFATGSFICLLRACILSFLKRSRCHRDSTTTNILPSVQPSKKQRLVINTHSLSDAPYISPSGHLTPNSPTSATRQIPLHFEFLSDPNVTVPPTPVVDNEGELLFRLNVSLSHSVGLLDTTPKQGFRSCVSSPVPASPKAELVRAATFAGTPGDPLGNFALPAQPRRHTLAVPTDNQDGPHRSPSVLSETSKASLGRAAYRRHDGPMPRPRSPCPSVYGVSTSYLKASSTTTLPDAVQAEPSFLNASSDMLQTEEAVFVSPEPRFIPMSANDIMRYDRNAKSHAMMQVEAYVSLLFTDDTFCRDPTTSDYSIKEYSVDYPFFE